MNHSTDATGSQEATEAKSLAARLREHLDRNAGLVREFTEVGEVDLARAFADISLAWRLVADALDGDADVVRALDQVDAANARGRAALLAARIR